MLPVNQTKNPVIVDANGGRTMIMRPYARADALAHDGWLVSTLEEIGRPKVFPLHKDNHYPDGTLFADFWVSSRPAARALLLAVPSMCEHLTSPASEASAQVFQFGGQNIRVVMLGGEPWFVAKDVGYVLQLGNTRSTVALLDDDEKGVHSMDTLGGKQKTQIVNEGGLYSLILRSRKPTAHKFKKWVTKEVLPSIRRTGSYGEPALLMKEAVSKYIENASANIEALKNEINTPALKSLSGFGHD